MIADCDTNVVFVADTLEPRFPQVHRGLKTILDSHGIPLRIIPGTRDIWCRDYMPVQAAGDRFVQFRYEPDYLTGKFRHLRADGKIGPTLPWIENCVQSDLVLDGGNVVACRNNVILTEKVLVANPRLGRGGLLAELENLLEVERVILIPPEPEDVTCHADGVVRFVDEGAVLVNEYQNLDQDYRNRLLRAFEGTGLNVVEIPYNPDPGVFEGMPSAVGNYVNFLRVGPLFVVPSYGLDQDDIVMNTLATEFSHLTLMSLDCRALARHGGVLNCCTWTIKDPSHPSPK